MWFFLDKAIVLTILLTWCAALDEDSFQSFKESKVRHVESAVQAESTLTYRLPNNSLPIAYDITLKTDIDRREFEFVGKVKILVRIVEESATVTLHYKQLEIDAINLLESDGSTVIASGLQFTQIPSHHFLVVTLPRAYQPDSMFVLEIAYRGELRDDAAGFYRANYTTPAGDVVWFATTQFEIHDARHAMPCYDEPGIRAPMTLTIVHGSNYSAVGNMDVASERDIDGGYTETRFKPTPRMQTYLLAFLVSDFESVDARDTRVPQKIYAKPHSIANNEADFAAGVVGPVLRAHESLLRVSYTLDKMDHAAITQFTFGAMENFGLITYLERALLLNPSTPPALVEASKFLIIRIIAHEYAHQYFGNIVSPQWWTYTWLNEGLATLFEVLIPSMLYPEMNFMHRFVNHNMPQAFRADGIGAWSMSQYVEHPDELWTKFNNIGYEKSGCVMRMFMEVMTRETFTKGLTGYLNEMYFKAATPDDLHRNLQAAYDADFGVNLLNVSEVMLTWETQPGYPLVSVQVYGNYVIVSQRRYPVSNGEIYSVPLTLATKFSSNFTETTPKQWLTSESAAFSQTELNFNASDNDWIVLNVQQVGYYRVDYDTTLWRAIIDQLKRNHEEINSINRAVLQDEIRMAWTELNRVTAGDVLDILSYFDKEDEPIAWSKAESTIATLHNRLLGTTVFESFLEYLRSMTEAHMSELGYESISEESSTVTSLRSAAKSWNCAALDENCLRHELKKLQDYLDSPSTSAAFDFCHAMRLISAESFDVLTQAVQLQPSLEHRESFLSGFGCSLSEGNLRLLLNISLSEGSQLSASERSNLLISTMGRSALALNLTMDFLISNANIVDSRIPASFSTILTALAAHINTESHVRLIEELLATLLKDGIIDGDDVVRVKSIYLGNIKWQIDNYAAISEWFAVGGVVRVTLSVSIMLLSVLRWIL